MKGKLLSFEEIIRLPHGTKVYVESKYSIDENAIINQEEKMIGNFQNQGIGNCIWYFQDLNSIDTVTAYNIKVYELLED